MMTTFTISPYLVTFLASFIVSFIIVFILLRQKGVAPKFIGYSMFLNIVLILYGAKMYTVVTSGFQYDFFNAGPASLGGVIGLFAGTISFGMIYREERKLFFQTYTLVIPLMYAIAKIGCYLMGCCHGIPYEGPLSVTYNNSIIKGGPYFPVQLAETFSFSIIFLICLGIYFSKHNSYVVPAVMILCAIGKFSLEIFREEHLGRILSTNQWVCIGFVVWGIVLIYQNRTTVSKKIKAPVV